MFPPSRSILHEIPSVRTCIQYSRLSNREDVCEGSRVRDAVLPMDSVSSDPD